MTESFEEEKDALEETEDVEDVDAVVEECGKLSSSDARRRLERVLEEKRLRDELEDFFDD